MNVAPISKCNPEIILSTSGCLLADGLPPSIWAAQTLRNQPQGVSCMPFDAFNLALHVGDDAALVQTNRLMLLQSLATLGVHQVHWLNQTHSTRVVRVDQDSALAFDPPDADAIVTDQAGVAIVVMTADCLPIVLCDADGREVACIHAGWRGLLNGVIESTVQAMQAAPTMAWLGAAIGPTAFEVGDEVRAAFVLHDSAAATAFLPSVNGRWLAHLYDLARMRLHALGVVQISGGDQCTVQDEARFYSFRRAARTGRMATVALIRPR